MPVRLQVFNISINQFGALAHSHQPDAAVAPVCRLTLRPGDDLRMYVENRT